ncbi:MAG: hypothetical protein ACQEXN_06690 [Actinomycetota bacterium]
MITRREAAQFLDIPPEMAKRHGIPSRISQEELASMDANPPAWLAQSRSNRTGKRPVWTSLQCVVCGHTETARPKKWWPEFTYVYCHHHDPGVLPELPEGWVRSEYDGIGAKFIGIVDVALPGS